MSDRLLLPHDRHHHGPPSRAHVALQVDDLLPRAQHRLAVGHGHRQRRPPERGLQVRMAVAVMDTVAARRPATLILRLGWNVRGLILPLESLQAKRLVFNLLFAILSSLGIVF